MISEWSMWTSLGNPGVTSFRGLLLARQAEGRLTVFTDVFLKSERQDGSWSEWEKIGDGSRGVRSNGSAVARHADGRLALFTIFAQPDPVHPTSTDTLFHLAQTAPDSGWGHWQDLGRPPTEFGFFLFRSTVSRLAVGTNADGRLEVFALAWSDVFRPGSSTAEVWHRWQTAPNGDFSPWARMPIFQRRSLTWPFNLQAAANEDGRQELFLVGDNMGHWHIWQTAPNNGWNCWRDEEHHAHDSIAVARNADGRLEVFLSSNGVVSHSFQSSPNNGWDEWMNFESPEGKRMRSLAVESHRDGRLVLFARDEDDEGDFWYIQQTEPGGNTWTSWTSLGRPEGAAGFPTSAPDRSGFVVGRNGSDQLQLVASDKKSEVWTISQA
jgi:hypothetical protein